MLKRATLICTLLLGIGGSLLLFALVYVRPSDLRAMGRLLEEKQTIDPKVFFPPPIRGEQGF